MNLKELKKMLANGVVPKGADRTQALRLLQTERAEVRKLQAWVTKSVFYGRSLKPTPKWDGLGGSSKNMSKRDRKIVEPGDFSKKVQAVGARYEALLTLERTFNV